MPESSGSSKIGSFARVFLVFLVVTIMFQLLLAKNELTSMGAFWAVILKTLGTSLGVSLLAAGVFVLFYRNDE